MSTYQLVTSKLNVDAAETFVQALQDQYVCYVFAGKHSPYSNNIITTPSDSTSTNIRAYDDMIFGKLVTASDVSLMTKKYTWTSGEVYDMYDDLDYELASKRFFVVIQDGINYRVYKCLYNNNGGESTESPFGTSLTPIAFPSDGYIWKYMYTIPSATMTKFATNEYIPVVANSAVSSAAISGGIEIIKVIDGGIGYNNYTMGSFGSATDINIGNNPLKFGLDQSASALDTYYDNCIIKISSGACINQHRQIVSYAIVSGKKVITIDTPFTGTIAINDTYEIYPNVFIYDNSGTATTNCVARAIVDANTGNSISKIEILNTGEGYRLATAELLPANVVNVLTYNEASLRPITSPPGGHGYDSHSELFSYYVGISANFVGNTIPLTTDNDFRTIGVLKDPLFANVTIMIDSAQTKGFFVEGEKILNYKPIPIIGTVDTTSGSTTITGTGTEFSSTFEASDRVIITDGINNILANVSSVSSATSMVLDKSPSFSSTNCSIYSIKSALALGIVTGYSPTRVTLTNVFAGAWFNNGALIGETSYCTAVVNNVSPSHTINGRPGNDFNAFNQLTTFVGTYTSPTAFIEDETISQNIGSSEASKPTALFHSLVNNVGSSNDYLYATNVSNKFLTTSDGGDGIIFGKQSNAYFTAAYKYKGEIVPDSGEVLYVENVDPITRSPTQTETIKLILEF